jgi:hypothetical protein
VETEEIYELNIENCVKKWSPICDALKIFDERKKKIIAEYAEKHQLKEKKYSIRSEENLLPVSLKILAALNLDNIKVEFTNIEETIDIYHTITPEESLMIKESNGMDIIQKIEGILLDELITKINSELKEGNTLMLDMLVYNFSLISEKNFPPLMTIRSKYKIK